MFPRSNTGSCSSLHRNRLSTFPRLPPTVVDRIALLDADNCPTTFHFLSAQLVLGVGGHRQTHTHHRSSTDIMGTAASAAGANYGRLKRLVLLSAETCAGGRWLPRCQFVDFRLSARRVNRLSFHSYNYDGRAGVACRPPMSLQVALSPPRPPRRPGPSPRR